MLNDLKVLAWMDSPLSVTGFGVVAKNLLGRLHNMEGFSVGAVGINHFDEHPEKMFESREEVPYRVAIGQDLSIQNGIHQVLDPMAREKTISFLANQKPDIFFVMRDLWDMVFDNVNGRPHKSSYFPLHNQLIKENGHNHRVVGHFPLEYRLHPTWVPALDMMDYGYCFTAGGMEQLKPWQDKIKWCPQGADINIFKPLKDFDKRKFKELKMKINPDSFVVLNVNRNQPRKDVESTIKSFAIFKQKLLGVKGPRPLLWLHMRPDDQFGDARELCKKHGLQPDQDVFFPPYFNVGTGWTNEELNMLYNTADLFISTSLAEGFGLTNVEAGTAGSPVLVPGHTGFLQTMGHLGMPYVKTLPPRMVEGVGPSEVNPTDCEDMADNILAHYKNPKNLQDLVRNNLKDFRKMFSWDNIFDEYWKPLFETVREDLAGTQKRQERNKDKFLFVCEEAAGDLVGASRAIAGIKKTYPDTELEFMAKNHFAPIQKGNPNIDKVIPWDINKIFDYPRERVMYPHAKIRHGNWSSGPYHLMSMQAHMVGVVPGDPYIDIEEFDFLLDDKGDKESQFITIHTTSQGGKMLTPDKWELIISNVLNHHPDIKFIVIGGPQDMMIRGAIDMRGLPWAKQAYLQGKAFCHIGIDSSPGHFASTVGCPSIIFWGWTNPEICKPQNHSINIAPHYPTVCPQLGPCHGITPKCGINQYDMQSAMSAPCLRSVDPNPAIQILLEALSKGIEEGREWLKEYSENRSLVFNIPKYQHKEDKAPTKTLAGVK